MKLKKYCPMSTRTLNTETTHTPDINLKLVSTNIGLYTRHMILMEPKIARQEIHVIHGSYSYTGFTLKPRHHKYR